MLTKVSTDTIKTVTGDGVTVTVIGCPEMTVVPPTALGVIVVIEVIVITPGFGGSEPIGWTYTVAGISVGTTVKGKAIPEGPTVTVIVPGMGGITGVVAGVGPAGEGSVTVKVESRKGLIPREKSF